MSVLSHLPPRVDGREPPYRITGRSLARQLRNASFAARDALISDVLRGKLQPVELTRRQRESVVAACLVVQRRPLDDKQRLVRLDRRADKLVDQLGVDVVFRAVDRKTQPQLPLQMAAE